MKTLLIRIMNTTIFLLNAILSVFVYPSAIFTTLMIWIVEGGSDQTTHGSLFEMLQEQNKNFVDSFRETWKSIVVGKPFWDVHL